MPFNRLVAKMETEWTFVLAHESSVLKGLADGIIARKAYLDNIRKLSLQASVEEGAGEHHEKGDDHSCNEGQYLERRTV